MKILVIEDEQFIRESISANLKKKGYKILEADNSRKAIDLIIKENLGLIISDLMLPFTGGLDVIEYVKSNPAKKNIPIILVTGMDDKILNSTRILADECIKKPFKMAELELKVQKYFPI